MLEPRPRGRGRLPGAGRLPGRARRRHAGRASAVAGRRSSGSPGSTAAASTVALLDTGVDLVASVPARAASSRASTSSTRAATASPSQNPTSPGRPERHGTELAGHRRRDRRAGRAARDRARRARSSRSAWPAGSPTPRAASPSTRAPTRCSPGSRLRSTRTTTATRTTPPGSRSSASSSRTRRSRTARSRRAVGGAAALDTLVVAPAGNDGAGRPDVRQRRRPRAARSPRSRSAPPTVARACRRSASSLRAGLDVLLSRAAAARRHGPAGDGDLAVTALGTGSGRGASPRGARSTGSSTSGATAASPARPRCSRVPGSPTPRPSRDLAQAGARAVLVDGPCRPGALSVDVPEQFRSSASRTALASRGAPVDRGRASR